jgi:hypothetical protein
LGIDRNKSGSHVSTVQKAQASPPPAPSKAVIPIPHPIDRPVIRRVSGKSVFSTPSILDALKDEPDTDETGRIVEDGPNPYTREKRINSFSQQELLEEWRKFVENIDAPQLKSALSAREPLLTATWQIEYELDTELQYNRLTLDLKPKLLGHLRRKFKNDAIEILFKVSDGESQEPNIPYTEAERWNLLVDKYPSLATLKSKFGLDFEHF